MSSKARERAISNSLKGSGLTALEFENSLREEGYTVVPQKLLSTLLSYSFKYLCITRKQK